MNQLTDAEFKQQYPHTGITLFDKDGLVWRASLHDRPLGILTHLRWNPAAQEYEKYTLTSC